MLHPLYKNDKNRCIPERDWRYVGNRGTNLVTSKDEEECYDFALNIIKIVWFFKNVSS